MLGSRMHGLDLCSIQLAAGPIDWWKVKKAGFDYAYVKSSQYSSTLDYQFDKLVAGAKGAGLAVGAYHYCSQATDAEKQAEFFYQACEGLGSKDGELPPMGDWEFCSIPPPQHCVAWLATFMRRITALWYPQNAQRQLDGLEPRMGTVYTFPNYGSLHQPDLGLATELARYPLSFASYQSYPLAWEPKEEQEPLHPLPDPWKSWAIWQYSGNGGIPIPGIGPITDRQVFNGGQAAFRSFCGYGTPASGGELGKASETVVERAVAQ